MTRPVRVLSPSRRTGGVESVAVAVHQALRTTPSGSRLDAGIGELLRGRRPTGPWVATTWKVHALTSARHPGTAHAGFVLTHGAELTRDSNRALIALRSRSLLRAELLLAVSPLSLELLPPDLHDRVELLGPPVTTHLLSGVRRPARGPVRLLSVGRAVPRKGHDLAIAATRALAVDHDVRLDVVGPGPDLPRLRALAADPGSRADVRVHGPVSAATKERLLAATDCLLFLPRQEAGEYDGLGLVVLEAAACGVPAVVLDCGGSRYTVHAGRTGQLLPAESTPEDVAAAVLRVAADAAAGPAAVTFAQRFALPAWQERVRAVVRGERPGWQWPAPAGATTRNSEEIA